MHLPLLSGHAKALLLCVCLVITGGCATTQGTHSSGYDEVDPIEPANRVIYSINETLDGLFVKPMAELYVLTTPEIIRDRVTNFFDNLGYLNVILNSFLQGKTDQGFSDTSRFLVNSTLGVGGLFDVATDMGLPRHQADFGMTLASWGAGQGAYLYLPVRGPNTVRDAPDIATSMFTNPFFYLASAVLYPVTAIGVINTRANLLEATRIRDEAALDPYVFTREAYLQRRNYLIHGGEPPAVGYDDIFDYDYEEDMENGGDMLRIE
jgi:phospholipid-binding lipoprotein MlaA